VYRATAAAFSRASAAAVGAGERGLAVVRFQSVCEQVSFVVLPSELRAAGAGVLGEATVGAARRRSRGRQRLSWGGEWG
jgi:hypothetical protein